MFIKSPLGRSYFLDSPNITGKVVINYVLEKENLTYAIEWRCEQNGKFVGKDDVLNPNVTATISPKGGLLGGKGGFGSLLRSIGAQIEKTTNHEAMRDLSGRRQRDVNNEQRLKKYVAGAAERERDAREKKEVKLEKLRRLAEGENKGKHDFCDPLYDKARSETEEKVHEAMEAAMAAAEAASSSSADTTTTATVSSSEEEVKDSKAIKRKDKEVDSGPVKKKPKGLWMGEGLDDLDESDLDDSDESDEEANKVAVK